MACCRCGCLRGLDRQRERPTAAAHLRANSAAPRGSYPAAARWTDGLGAGTLALGRLPLHMEARPLCPESAGIPPLRRRSLDLGAPRRTVDLASRTLGVEVGRAFSAAARSAVEFGRFRATVALIAAAIGLGASANLRFGPTNRWNNRYCGRASRPSAAIGRARRMSPRSMSQTTGLAALL